MRYFAILRDSFREAVDSKILYVTVGLSALLVLVLLSTQFRPVTVRDDAELIASQLNLIFSLQAKQMQMEKPPKADVVSYDRSGGGGEPWTGTHRFLVEMNLPAGPLARFQREPLRNMLRQILTEGMKESGWKKVEVAELTGVPAAAAGAVGLALSPPAVGAFAAAAEGADDGMMAWRRRFRVPDEEAPSLFPSGFRETAGTARVLVTVEGNDTEDMRSWRHEASLLFGLAKLSWVRAPLEYSVYWVENWLVNGLGAWIIALIGVIVTAFFVPNMMQKGTIDLMLAKPVNRVWLLLLKYVGGLSFVFLNSLLAIGGVWLALGLRTGIWTWGFPLTAVVITFFFAILYSVSVLMGVWSRNSVVAIFVTLAVWFVLFLNGWLYSFLTNVQQQADEKLGRGSSAAIADSPTFQMAYNASSAIHTVLPRTDELGELTTRLVTEGLLSPEEQDKYKIARPRSATEEDPAAFWAESLGVSAGFIAVMLGLACWLFATRDY